MRILSLALCLVSLTWVWADDDEPLKPRLPGLGKSDKQEQPKGEAGKLDGQPKPAENKEMKELLARVAKNMEASDDRLKKKDTGNETRTIQDQIIKDLDKLLKQQENSQNSSGGGGSSSQGSKSSSSGSSGSSGSQGAQGNKSGQGNSTGQGNQAGQGNPTGQGGQGNQGQGGQNAKTQGGAKQLDTAKGPGGQKEEKTGQAQQKDQKTGQGQGQQNAKAGGNGAGDNKDTKEQKNTVADLFKDVWGHLPETKRQEMDTYSKERFMPRYQNLLQQYYRTIAAQGRQKEGD